MKRAYYITGVAGTGKSTIGAELKNYGYTVFDIDKIEGLCHWKHKQTGEKAIYHTGVGKDWIDAHDWLCDFERLKKMLDAEEKNAIVVGIASNQEAHFDLFNKVFLLYCNKQTFIRRLNTRDGGNNFAKDETEQEQILGWYEYFQERVKKLGAIPINTEKSVKEVAFEINRNIRNTP